jgi:ElaB/YqjD/DUF883 family membrane-anchored ribosome-binding protein
MISNTNTNLTSKPNGLNKDFDLEKMSQGLGEQLGQRASQALETTQDYFLAGRQYVEKNPVKGVAVAAVTGLALGSLLTMLLQKRSE